MLLRMMNLQTEGLLLRPIMHGCVPSRMPEYDSFANLRFDVELRGE